MLFGTTTTPLPALCEYTGFLVNWCAAQSRVAFGDALEPLGVRPTQFAVLSVIDDQPGMTQQALVEATGIDPSTMVQLLDSLEQAGWAERRPHATDRRKRAVHLTKDGRAVLVRARKAADGVDETTLAPLAEEEREQLHVLLRKLAGLEHEAAV